jgi:membrane associated rhomboid family serine protease
MSANNWQAGTGNPYAAYQAPSGDQTADKPEKPPGLLKRVSTHILHSVDSFLGTNEKQPANQASFFEMKDEEEVESDSSEDEASSSDDESLEELEGSLNSEEGVEMQKEPINGHMNGHTDQPISNNSMLSPSTGPSTLNLHPQRMNSFLALSPTNLEIAHSSLTPKMGRVDSFVVDADTSNMPLFPEVTRAVVIDTSKRSQYQGKGHGRGRDRPRKQDQRTVASAQANMKKGHKAKKKLPPIVMNNRSPYFIVVVSAINLMLLIWELVLGGFEEPAANPMLGPPAYILIVTGGRFNPDIIYKGQWWRFITAMFLHTGFVHIAMNLLTQIFVGLKLERLHGSFRVWPVYMLSGAFGNIFSAIFLPGTVSVGASGALFGFYGVLLVDLLKNWKAVPNPKRGLIIMVVGLLISFAMGLMPGVDNYCHIGGFVMGILSGIVFIPAMHIGKFNRKARLIQVIVVAPIMIAVFIVPYIVFYSGLPPINQWCPNCRYLSCMPFFPPCQ